MKRFVYTDRSERTLENLLIWWGTNHGCEHSASNPNELDCFVICSLCPPPLPYSIESIGFSFRVDEEIPCYFTDPMREIKRLLEPGDTIVFNPETREMWIEP